MVKIKNLDMKKIIMFLIPVFLFTGCFLHKKQVDESSDNTSSFKNAIVIKEKTERTGVNAEYKWIAEHYPDAKVLQQRLVNNNGKPYDIIDIKTKSGKKSIYFDISNFFGKF